MHLQIQEYSDWHGHPNILTETQTWRQVHSEPNTITDTLNTHTHADIHQSTHIDTNTKLCYLYDTLKLNSFANRQIHRDTLDAFTFNHIDKNKKHPQRDTHINISNV